MKYFNEETKQLHSNVLKLLLFVYVVKKKGLESKARRGNEGEKGGKKNEARRRNREEMQEEEGHNEDERKGEREMDGRRSCL